MSVAPPDERVATGGRSSGQAAQQPVRPGGHRAEDREGDHADHRQQRAPVGEPVAEHPQREHQVQPEEVEVELLPQGSRQISMNWSDASRPGACDQAQIDTAATTNTTTAATASMGGPPTDRRGLDRRRGQTDRRRPDGGSDRVGATRRVARRPFSTARRRLRRPARSGLPGRRPGETTASVPFE